MLIVCLENLHVLLDNIVVKQEGDWWFARVAVVDLFVQGNGSTPWEALGNMLTHPQLNEKLKRLQGEAGYE